MKNKNIKILLMTLLVALVWFGISNALDNLQYLVNDSTEMTTVSASNDSSASDIFFETNSSSVSEDGMYTSEDEVAEYIYSYNKLPKNFITKNDAEDLGWESSKGNLWDVTNQMSIGGDTFGNREGLLPKAQGRKWYECDINYTGGFRGAERLVYSSDGLIYYTNDHYETFKQLY